MIATEGRQMTHLSNDRPVLGRHRIDQAVLDQLRNDPEVNNRRRSSRAVRPFVPQIRVTAPVDELDLIGRGASNADDDAGQRCAR